MVQVSYGIVLMTFYHPLTAQEASKGLKRRDSVFTVLNLAFFNFHALRNLHFSKVFFMQFSKCYSTLSYILSKCSNFF
jgi:hypothetical protein